MPFLPLLPLLSPLRSRVNAGKPRRS